MTDEIWLTTGDVAALADVTREAVRQWAREGKLPMERRANGHRVFRKADVEGFLHARVPDWLLGVLLFACEAYAREPEVLRAVAFVRRKLRHVARGERRVSATFAGSEGERAACP